MESTARNSGLDDWSIFVLRHTNLWNVRIHLFSALCFWLSPVLAYFVSPWFLLGFFASGLIGAFGHYVTKDSGVNFVETTHDPQVVRFSTKMAWMFLKGQYNDEIERVKELWRQQSREKVSSN
ncbi:MAG: hypothetical protein HRT45_01425 [Bdellovibrionales bacterium]|nr:hypothetical protein [Bdellovibrionales bacterium]